MVDPFTEITVIIVSFKELARRHCFTYGKLKKFLSPLCPITGCRPVIISFDTCTTRIDSLKRFWEPEYGGHGTSTFVVSGEATEGGGGGICGHFGLQYLMNARSKSLLKCSH